MFVVTYGRSGSTLVQKLLNQLPGACIRGENGNALLHVAQAWNAVVSSPNLNRMAKRTSPTDPASPWYGGETIDAQAYGTSLAQAFTNHILCPPRGTRIAGFKEIRWTRDPLAFPVMLKFLVTCFPNTHFVFNTRDHADTAQSGWWADMKPEKVAKALKTAEDLYDAFLTEHPDRGVRIHYNDYVADQDTLRPMYAFLGEEFDPDSVRQTLSQKLTHLQKEGKA